MHIIRLVVMALCLLIAGCVQPETMAPIPTPQAAAPTPQPVITIQVPITVEVTRIVTQQVLVETTPVPPQPCASQRYAETGEITIGALLPLSAPGAFSAGFAMQTALNLAFDHLQRTNGAGERATFRLVSYDTAGRPERAAEFAHRLIMLDCAAGIIGGYHSQVAAATAELADAYNTPYIIVHAADDELTAAQRPSTFRLAPSFSMYAAMPAELLATLRDQRGLPIEDVLFITDPATVGLAFAEQIEAQVEAGGIAAETLFIDLPTRDFSAVVARILSRPSLPNVIFIQVKSRAALLLHAQLLRAGIGPTHSVIIVNSSAAMDADAFWDAVPDGTGAIITQYGPWPGSITPMGQEFAEKYQGYTGDWPESLAFASFDATLLLAHAAIHAASFDGPTLSATLAKVDLTLATGQIQFQVNQNQPLSDDDTPPYYWQQWSGFPRYYLEYTAPGQTIQQMQTVWPLNTQTSGVSSP